MFIVKAIFPALTLLLGLVALYRSRTRTAYDVLADLRGEDQDSVSINSTPKRSAARRGEKYKIYVIPMFGAFLAMTTAVVFFNSNIAAVVIVGLAVASALFLASAKVRAARVLRTKREIEFYLPLVMERLVMAAEAGLDIIPAISTVVSAENDGEVQPGGMPDPVSLLLMKAVRMTESGSSFPESLDSIANSVESSPLKHAFAHLALAQKHGGELVAPLRELSDSTQLYYQETIEEEIAKLPVKATLPLLCTFAGLIICFITSPIIQIVTITSQSIP